MAEATAFTRWATPSPSPYANDPSSPHPLQPWSPSQQPINPASVDDLDMLHIPSQFSAGLDMAFALGASELNPFDEEFSNPIQPLSTTVSTTTDKKRARGTLTPSGLTPDGSHRSKQSHVYALPASAFTPVSPAHVLVPGPRPIQSEHKQQGSADSSTSSSSNGSAGSDLGNTSSSALTPATSEEDDTSPGPGPAAKLPTKTAASLAAAAAAASSATATATSTKVSKRRSSRRSTSAVAKVIAHPAPPMQTVPAPPTGQRANAVSGRPTFSSVSSDVKGASSKHPSSSSTKQQQSALSNHNQHHPKHASNTSVSTSRPSQASAAAPAPALGADDDSDTEMKRRQFLERNRLAACKSRTKKKEWIGALEGQADELAMRNAELAMVVRAMREEADELRELAKKVENCGCGRGVRGMGGAANANAAAAGGRLSTAGLGAQGINLAGMGMNVLAPPGAMLAQQQSVLAPTMSLPPSTTSAATSSTSAHPLLDAYGLYLRNAGPPPALPLAPSQVPPLLAPQQPLQHPARPPSAVPRSTSPLSLIPPHFSNAAPFLAAAVARSPVLVPVLAASPTAAAGLSRPVSAASASSGLKIEVENASSPPGLGEGAQGGGQLALRRQQKRRQSTGPGAGSLASPEMANANAKAPLQPKAVRHPQLTSGFAPLTLTQQQQVQQQQRTHVPTKSHTMPMAMNIPHSASALQTTFAASSMDMLQPFAYGAAAAAQQNLLSQQNQQAGGNLFSSIVFGSQQGLGMGMGGYSFGTGSSAGGGGAAAGAGAGFVMNQSLQALSLPGPFEGEGSDLTFNLSASNNSLAAPLGGSGGWGVPHAAWPWPSPGRPASAPPTTPLAVGSRAEAFAPGATVGSYFPWQGQGQAVAAGVGGGMRLL